MSRKVSYFQVTELPGQGIHSEQLERLYHRYKLASSYCEGKDVLEVACGGGMGLGYLAEKAKKVTGTDIDRDNLNFAREYYSDKDNVEIRLVDAQELLFPDNSFDVVIFYEAIYYLNNPGRFVEEAFRVLRDNGVLIVCTVNKEWSDFNPSPHSYQYYSAQQLKDLLSDKFPEVDILCAFSTKPESFKAAVISWIKRMAVSLNLIPKSMKGKEILKKIFFGKLRLIPSEITDGMSRYTPPVGIEGSKASDFKIIYALASKKKLDAKRSN